jgi:hypothetical protein
MLLKTLAALVPAFVLFSGSIVSFSRQKTVSSLLQLLGAGCLVMVVLTHVSEALRLFPWMDWGLEDSVGHYLDFWSAVLVLRYFPQDICCIPLQRDAPKNDRPRPERRGDRAAVHAAGPYPQGASIPVGRNVRRAARIPVLAKLRG